jgi:MscS family membrane protein
MRNGIARSAARHAKGCEGMKRRSFWIFLFVLVFTSLVFHSVIASTACAATKSMPAPTAQPAPPPELINLNPQGNMAGLIKAANRDDHSKVDLPFLDQVLPDKLTHVKILHLPLTRWISFIVILPLLAVAARLLGLALIAVLRPFIRRIAKRDDDRAIELFKNPFSLFLLAVAIFAYVPLTESTFSRLFWSQLAVTLVVVSLTWLAIRFIDVLADRVSRNYENTASSGRIGITRLVGQFSKGLAVVVAAATILAVAGINLTAVLTGLGVGGIAIAFAAQKTLENLFGGIMIASDQPIRVGDFCRAGEYSGTVEGIGLRSTRIRTMDRTLVSVPNGQLSVMSLENFALRDKIRLSHTVALQCDISAEQIRKVLEDVRKTVTSHEDIEQGSARVRLVGVRNGAIEIELFAYVATSSWERFLAVQEEILLAVIGIIQETGAALAYPGSVPSSGDGKNDAGKARRNDKDGARKRRDQGALL